MTRLRFLGCSGCRTGGIYIDGLSTTTSSHRPTTFIFEWIVFEGNNYLLEDSDDPGSDFYFGSLVERTTLVSERF